MEDILHTIDKYDIALSLCESLFKHKTADYGTAWRILRTSSLTDQIFIKANRIRTIQEVEVAKVDEGITPEFIGIVNYSLMALVQLELPSDYTLDLPADEANERFQNAVKKTRDLMLNKNHDYGEAWRDMRVSSLTDLILQKLLRVKQIEDNDGNTIMSEGIDANYLDMLNYAVFALIKLNK